MCKCPSNLRSDLCFQVLLCFRMNWVDQDCIQCLLFLWPSTNSCPTCFAESNYKMDVHTAAANWHCDLDCFVGALSVASNNRASDASAASTPSNCTRKRSKLCRTSTRNYDHRIHDLGDVVVTSLIDKLNLNGCMWKVINVSRTERYVLSCLWIWDIHHSCSFWGKKIFFILNHMYSYWILWWFLNLS